MTELDNRDLSTTRIWQEVEVWELLDNALENSGFPEGMGRALHSYFAQRLESALSTADDAKYIDGLSLQEHMYTLGKYLVRFYE